MKLKRYKTLNKTKNTMFFFRPSDFYTTKTKSVYATASRVHKLSKLANVLEYFPLYFRSIKDLTGHKIGLIYVA